MTIPPKYESIRIRKQMALAYYYTDSFSGIPQPQLARFHLNAVVELRQK